MEYGRIAMSGTKKLLLALVAFSLPAILGAQSEGKTINAIGYPVGGGSTTIDLISSGPMAGAKGEAKVEAKASVTTVEVEVEGLRLPNGIAPELLTYVLWGVSQEGTAANLGELMLDNSGKSKLKVTTQLKSFSLFVTAEPYSTVRKPSEFLIMENQLRKGTKGRIYPVHNYKLMKHSYYQLSSNPMGLTLDLKNFPLEVYEARNSVEIAKAKGAPKYAPEIFSKAEGGLSLMENAIQRKLDKKQISSLARQTTQISEDSRALAAERIEEERITNEKAAAAAAAKQVAEEKAALAAAEAKQKADAEAAEAKRKADDEARRQAEMAAAKEAQLKAEASAKQAQLRAEAAAKEAQMKAEATIAEARAKAEADAIRAREEAAKADAERAKKAASDLRAQLLDQFNRVLATKDTPRGLVITMADVLFDTGKYAIRPPTREQLARLSGILLAHPTLHLEVEGFTDSTGGDELNQKLSEQRASTVRDYLITMGLAADSIKSKGFGKDNPVDTNDTAAGRQKNRRVEIIVSGDVIGVKLGQ